MNNTFSKLLKGKISIKDVFYYLQGNFRYYIYYNPKLTWLIRKHIKEQIDYRISVMNPICYSQGSCIKCGCMTTALQMCNKKCEGNCYPYMMNKINWNRSKITNHIEDIDGSWFKVEFSEIEMSQGQLVPVIKFKYYYVHTTSINNS